MRGSDSPPAPPLPSLLLATVAPDGERWLAWLCPQIDDTLLLEIAEADYGYRADEYFAALCRIRDERRLSHSFSEFPQEVLQLMRWSQPDDPSWKPGHQGPDGHRVRLFCCAELLLAAGDAQFAPYLDDPPTLLPCVASAVSLGAAAIDAVLPLLVWRAETPTTLPADRAFLACAIALLAAARYREPADAPLLVALCDWAVESEAWARAAADAPTLLTAPWLFGLEFSAEGHDRWRDLAWQLLIEPARPHPPGAATALHQLGARLVLGDA